MAVSGLADTGDRLRTITGLSAGGAAVAAGLCWTVKAVAVLTTGHQPTMLFELAPLLMTIAVLGLGQQLPPGKPRIVASSVAAAALLASLGVLAGQVMPLPEVVYGIAIASANLAILVSLVTAGLSLRHHRDSYLPLGLGLTTVPALLIGGLAAEVLGERALELPLAALGATWVVLGVQLSLGRYQNS